MNRYLLDTHILIWWLYDLPQLHSTYRKVIENEENDIIVSTASLWEIEIKRALGKLVIDGSYYEAIKQNGFTFLPIFPTHTLALRDLPNIHKDPFDRMLIAQTICEKLIFITDDKLIARYPITILTPPRTA